MTAVVGRVWGWVRPAISYRPWSNSAAVSQKARGEEPVRDQKLVKGSWGLGGLATWVWGTPKKQSDQTQFIEEFWEAEEKVEPMAMEDLGVGNKGTGTKALNAPGWWSKILPSSYFWSKITKSAGLRQRKCVGWNQGGWDSDNEEFSDYGTPPPSPTPTPSQQSSPFRFFAPTWTGEITPEQFEICFNFLRHLFDLFVVGFLWTVSPPAKLILEVLGVQGALKLWFHGMAMFFVSTVGMAGLLWLIQEYLPQFALVYGIVQALVISVSIKQSVILGGDEELKEDQAEKEDEDEDVKDGGEQKELLQTSTDEFCLE